MSTIPEPATIIALADYPIYISDSGRVACSVQPGGDQGECEDFTQAGRRCTVAGLHEAIREHALHYHRMKVTD